MTWFVIEDVVVLISELSPSILLGIAERYDLIGPRAHSEDEFHLRSSLGFPSVLAIRSDCPGLQAGNI